MIRISNMTIGSFALFGCIVGCQTQPPPTSKVLSQQVARDGGDAHQHSTEESHEDHPTQAADPKITATLAKLSPENREMAETQQFCAVMNRERLGSMGVPLKIEIKGEPVFVCCAACKKKAIKNPDETLQKVAALKSAHKSAQP